MMLIAATLIAATLFVQDGYNPPDIAAPVISTAVAIAAPEQQGSLPSLDDFAQMMAMRPPCHEDEVVVLVVWDPYEQLGNFEIGCVPADNLPVDGYRPDRDQLSP